MKLNKLMAILNQYTTSTQMSLIVAWHQDGSISDDEMKILLVRTGIKVIR